MSFTTSPLFSKVVVVVSEKYSFISDFNCLALPLSFIIPPAFLTDPDIADLKSDILTSPLSNITSSIAKLEFTPDTLLISF